MDDRACKAFNNLEAVTAFHCPDNSKSYMIECDASEVVILASLNQFGSPVAFMLQTINQQELHYPAIEEEAIWLTS